MGIDFKGLADAPMVIVAANAVATSIEELERERNRFAESFNREESSIALVHTDSREELALELRRSQAKSILFSGGESESNRICFRDQTGHLRNITGSTLSTILMRAEVIPALMILDECRLFNREEEAALSADYFVRISETSSQRYRQSIVSAIAQSLVAASGVAGFGTGLASLLASKGIAESVRMLTRAEAQRLIRERDSKSGSARGGAVYGRKKKSAKALTESETGGAGGAGNAKTVSTDTTAKTNTRDEEARKLSVWYGTNRLEISPDKIGCRFGARRSDELVVGRCEVSVPKWHKIGEVGNLFWKRWPPWRDDRLRVVSRMTEEPGVFWSEMAEFVSALPRDERTAIIFIHGYRVSFDEAIIRAAQLGADLNLPGITAAFSWPSRGKLAKYLNDEATIGASVPFLAEFVETLLQQSNAERVHIIAHSMGNRALVRMADKLFASLPEESSDKVKQIVLAAPDIDRGEFLGLAKEFPAHTERTTLYACSKDKALKGSSSGLLHGFPRAGLTPPITISNGVDTVDVSDLDLGLMGHGYIAEHRTVIADLHSLLASDLDPSKRFGVRMLKDKESGMKYWALNP